MSPNTQKKMKIKNSAKSREMQRQRQIMVTQIVTANDSLNSFDSAAGEKQSLVEGKEKKEREEPPQVTGRASG